MPSYLDDGGPAFPQPYPPESFQKAIVFVDGTNLFNRLREAKIRLPRLLPLVSLACNGRQLLRAAVYTTGEKLDVAYSEHGKDLAEGCRVILGDSVKSGSGNVREKGVDALLVADLVYHAAQKNCQYATVLSHDSDFRFALKRVEDFGCKTGVMAIGTNAPDRLVKSCDDYWFLPAKYLVEKGWAEKV